MAKPQKAKEGSSRAVWADDEWLKKYAGASGETSEEKEETEETAAAAPPPAPAPVAETSKRPAEESVSLRSYGVPSSCTMKKLLYNKSNYKGSEAPGT